MEYIIRNEAPADERIVEELTRRAFWNLHGPGCDEHYLVHLMRDHRDFIPELAFVMEKDSEIIGSILYTRCCVRSNAGVSRDVATFGPVFIVPERQRQGYGAKLIRYSMSKAAELGFGAIVIVGNPGHYVGLGFQSCIRYGLSLPDGTFPTALLVKELKEGYLTGSAWHYEESEVYAVDHARAAEFDAQFPPRERRERPQHEEFFILSNSRLMGRSP